MKAETYTRRGFLKMVGLGAASIALHGCASTPQPGSRAARANIVLIMADDMGYSDIGCYGSEIRTPTLNKLAASGLRFTHFYNTARCCPTRASLMTGLYPHQTGIGHMTGDKGRKGYRGDLNKNCVTIAQVLKGAGYSTYMSGKWHVTKHIAPEGPKHNWPRQRGFDKFYGTIFGAGSFYDPSTLTRDNTMISPLNDPEYQPKDYYYTDAISDNAIKFISGHDPSNPFFLYVAYTAAHWPMHARKKDIEKYKGRYDKGWDALRAERHKKMLELGVVEEHWPMSPPDNDGWENTKNKEWYTRRMEVYAAMVEVMDRGIGRIVAELKRTGQFENTLILYLQDNGGCAEELDSEKPMSPDPSEKIELKPMTREELQVHMRPPVTRDGRPVKTGYGVMPGPDDTYVAYGRQWANVSDTPFRLYKHYVHEGGIATPLIAHWPARIKDKGELRHQPGHLVDIMTTCVDVAKAKYPSECSGEPIVPMEGKGLLGAFDNKPIQREAIYWEHEGNRAVRQGKWKLVARSRRGQWELYDMEKDRTELNNLAEVHPWIAKELAQLWTNYAKRTNVLPWPSKKKRKQKNKSK